MPAKELKNILVIERRGHESTYGFIESINDINNLLMKKAIIAALNSDDLFNFTYLQNGSEEIGVRCNEITSEYGFYFGTEKFHKRPPFEVEHIIEHITE